MSNMKCPICGNDLEQYHTGLVCYRHCLNGKNVWGGEETLKDLDRTRKALEIAKDTFNWIDETYQTGQEMEAEIWGKVQLAAQEIIALEQKDGK